MPFKPSVIRSALLIPVILILTGSISLPRNSPAPANAITVNTGEDQYDTDPAHCSLREAIQAANTDTAFGGCPAGSGADTITIQNGIGNIQLMIEGGYGSDNSQGDFNITSDMTIQGYGWQTTIIDAGCNPTPSRVFHIYNASSLVSVTIQHLSIFYGDSRNEGGGTIANFEDLTLSGVSIHESHSNANGGAIYSSPGDYSQSLSIQASSFVGNSSGYSGGAIANFGELLIEDSYFSGNDANLASLNPAYQGGGLYNGGTPLTIRRSTFSDNQAGGGGGNLFLETSGGSMLIEDSTLTGGIAGENGGNLTITTNPAYNMSVTLRRTEISDGQANFGLGGGIYNDNNLTLENVTISGNQAQIGGGIYTAATEEIMQSVYKNITLTDNLDANLGVGGDGLYVATSSQIDIYNSILAMNGPDTILGFNCDCYTTIPLSAGYNLERGTSCGFTQTGDIQNKDPKLNPLSYNWGFNRTHSLSGDSSAVMDHGNDATCLSEDQRGWYRPVDGEDFDAGIATCDIGAYEYGHVLQFLPLLLKFP
jgi:CSLREA domain-containing protein